HSPTVVGRSEPRAQTSFHFWGIPLDPTPHREVIGVQTSLGEQLLDVPVRQGKTQIPTNRQKDDFRFELPPLEQTGNRRRKEHWRSISDHSCKVETLPFGLRCVQNEQSARRSEPDWRSSHFFGQC